jgi:hypothetical protein
MINVNGDRHRMAKQLLLRGSATMRELLEMSFGEWPPRGLDISPAVAHGQCVPIEISDKPSEWLGLVQRGVRGMQLSGALREATPEGVPASFGRATLHSVAAHEAVHVLQFDNTLRAEEMFGKDVIQKRWMQLHPTEAESYVIMKELHKVDRAEPGYDPVYPARMEADRQLAAAARIQREYEQFNSGVPAKRRLSAHFNACASRLDYFKTGHEIQARLHQALSDGYQEWKRLPQNKEELWQAMLAIGLTPPPGVAAQLENLPEGDEARRFNTASLSKMKYCREMAIGYHSLSDPAREMFWEQTMPAIYADLIEMYGDRKGRERFGLGPNIKGRMQAEAARNKKEAAHGPA